MAVHPTGATYVGFPWVFFALFNTPVPDNNQGGPVVPVLSYARELTSWRMATDHSPSIALGAAGEWDSGSIYTASSPVIEGDETWLYYGAENVDHGAKMHLTHLAHIDPKFKGGIGLATWKRDRFSAIVSDTSDGSFQTVPLRLKGRRLVINADASAGAISVELLRPDGRPVPGFAMKDCVPFKADELDHEVRWNGRDDLGTVADQPLVLRFALDRAKLYSFRCDDTK